MTIKKCDRCGAVIPDGNSGKTIGEVISDAVNCLVAKIHTMPVYKITVSEGLRSDVPVDLCDKCNKTFAKWLNDSEGVK